jgi:uncharacterized membrane protein YoaK (UPF0700 family)
MKEDLLENVSEDSIYSVKAIVLSTFFGGLLAGGFMMYQNFKTFGEHKKASLTIVFVILTFIALIATAFLPALEKIPNILYNIIITLTVSFLVKKHQEALVTKHINAGGKTFTTGRVILICVLSIILVIAFFLGVFFLQDIQSLNE